MKLTEILREVVTPQYWYDNGNPFMGDLMVLERSLEQKYPELEELNLTGKKGVSITVHSIKVKPKYQGQGIGGKVLKDIKEFATKLKLPILLTPEADRGKKDALARFYKSHGFEKCKDARFTSMFGPVLMWKPV